MNQMRRFIIGGLLGAFLGFTGQLVADMTRFIDIPHLSWKSAAIVSVPSDIPRLFSDGPPYYWAYSPNGRVIGTPYMSVDRRPVLPKNVVVSVTPSANQKSQWQTLWYQLLFLNWLQQDGEVAGRTAAIAALLAALAVFGVDCLRRKRLATAFTSQALRP
jgi:hypothetical protein